MKSILGGVLAILAVFIAAAGYGAESAVLPGWDADFVSVTNRALTSHRPIVLVWANTGCEYCEELEKEARQSDFVKWRESREYEFCFVMGVGGKDPAGAEGAKEFARTAGGTQSAGNYYPFECLYWAKADGTVAAKRFSRSTGAQLMKEADALFAGYVPMPDYIGGDLAFTGEYANARLEAAEGFTEYVDVPLVRDGAAAPFPATNTLSATFGGAEIQRETVLWGKNETARSVRVAIPGAVKAGDEIAVALRDAAGAVRGSVRVFVVDMGENSTKNPFFIGERTAATLGYGEWTMDLDVAMEKYHADPDAKLMAVASGSLWCPDCVMTDAHVLETAAFKTWAVENKVILVDIDVPNFPNTTNSACLLTRVVGRTSDGYVSGRGTLATNELERYQSGAGYLSRHMVSDADAAAVLERNRALIGRNTLDGGWNSPDRANQNRTGIPNFFAIRRDGTLAGTFEAFDAIGPSEFKEAYLKRFSELIALCGEEAAEFDNRSWQTTGDEYPGTGAGASGTLSAVDLVDVYRISPTEESASEQTVTVSGSDADATVTVSIVAVANGSPSTLATATGRLSDGVSVSGVIVAGGDYYLYVTGDGTGTFAADAEADSTASYSINGSRQAIENPYANEWTTRAVAATLPLFAQDGVSLKGTLALTFRKNGKISAKYSNGKNTVATFSGRWNDAIAADGTATATMSKKGLTLSIVMAGDGAISAEVNDGTTSLASCRCGLAEEYGEFSGCYTVAMPAVDVSPTMLPAGNAVMTLKMATTKTAKAKGAFRYTVYLPDGKKLSGTTGVTLADANFGIVPVLKTSGSTTFAAALKVRRSAGSAPSARAILALDGTSAVWTNAAKQRPFTRKFGVYGSWYDKSASLLDGINEESLALKFSPATEAVEGSPSYGALVSVAGYNAKITVTGKKMSTEKIAGFTLKASRTTGLVTGTARLEFEGKPRVAAKYTAVLLRGWFNDCDCGEDNDPLIEMQNLAFASGFCLFSDKVERKTVKRSFPVEVK